MIRHVKDAQFTSENGDPASPEINSFGFVSRYHLISMLAILIHIKHITTIFGMCYILHTVKWYGVYTQNTHQYISVLGVREIEFYWQQRSCYWPLSLDVLFTHARANVIRILKVVANRTTALSTTSSLYLSLFIPLLTFLAKSNRLVSNCVPHLFLCWNLLSSKEFLIQPGLTSPVTSGFPRPIFLVGHSFGARAAVHLLAREDLRRQLPRNVKGIIAQLGGDCSVISRLVIHPYIKIIMKSLLQ